MKECVFRDVKLTNQLSFKNDFQNGVNMQETSG